MRRLGFRIPRNAALRHAARVGELVNRQLMIATASRAGVGICANSKEHPQSPSCSNTRTQAPV
eukprot:scaffold7994_cov122-Isochrysis_galbana.AAC.2